ncbi:cell division protein FtsK [Brevibacillus panacihumi W25]|uniref:Cell division protein FtsK n=2 Tax=Bacillales TaxID=1385 RepID=V6M4D7_9BACL|nr:DNA translocase FtsK [Brevibacillus panacihumi]EST53182.1 cell division protein FtsK [Brevibacillus panacihumi W25]
MWSWFQKLMNVFRGEEREVDEDETHPPNHTKSRQLQAKTKSIYPRERESSREHDEFRTDKQRQFRFPVVPDHYPERRRIEKEMGLDPDLLEGNQENQSSSRERLPNRRAAKAVEQPEEKTLPVKKQQVDHRGASTKPGNQKTAGSEKRAYQPSDIVSPVYGKITPATMEMEHRIHTTAGIVYPLQEQEEQLNQLKLWQQMQMAGKTENEPQEMADEPAEETAADEAAAASEATVEKEADTSIEPVFLFARKQQPPVEEEESEEETAWPEAPQHESSEAKADHVIETEAVAEVENETESEIETETEIEAETVIEEPQIPDTSSGVVEFLESEISPDQEEDDVAGEDESIVFIESDMEQGEEKVDFEKAAMEAGQSPEIARLLERAEFSPLTTVEEEQDDTAATPVNVTYAAPLVHTEPLRIEPVQKPTEQKQPDDLQAVPSYQLPSLDLLNPSPEVAGDDDEHTQLQKLLLEETLANFNVSAQVVGIVKGPSVTRFELQPAPGVKVNKITSLIDDIKLNLAAKDIRIEAPIPGRNAIGIEVPNLSSQPVLIEKIIGSAEFQQHPSALAVALGMDIGGAPIIADIKKMPHGLIAGATGSGKSVCINSIIVSLLYKATPEQVRLLLIDPKMVELAPYNHLPHLVTPVVTEAKQATAALKWAVEEMEKRYALFVDAGVRDIERYNQTTDDHLPYIVIVIDELADLMMVSPQDVEDCIIRIAQKARACGIHLLLATQRPSVDVITGNIKANVPTRLAFAVFSQVDSRTILDQSGAERLLGRGDMLFLESGTTPLRLQGNFVSDDEIERITHIIKKQRKPSYLFSKEDLEQQVQSFDAGDDPLYLEALVFVAEQGQASASGLQRRFRVGYNRAARLIEMMEADGYVAGQSGGKARAVLITLEDAQAVAEGSSLV